MSNTGVILTARSCSTRSIKGSRKASWALQPGMPTYASATSALPLRKGKLFGKGCRTCRASEPGCLRLIRQRLSQRQGEQHGVVHFSKADAECPDCVYHTSAGSHEKNVLRDQRVHRMGGGLEAHPGVSSKPVPPARGRWDVGSNGKVERWKTG